MDPAARVALGSLMTSETSLFTCPVLPVIGINISALMEPYVMVRVPVVVPTTPGVKTMVTVHELLAAKEVPQVLPVIA